MSFCRFSSGLNAVCSPPWFFRADPSRSVRSCCRIVLLRSRPALLEAGQYQFHHSSHSSRSCCLRYPLFCLEFLRPGILRGNCLSYATDHAFSPLKCLRSRNRSLSPSVRLFRFRTFCTELKTDRHEMLPHAEALPPGLPHTAFRSDPYAAGLQSHRFPAVSPMDSGSSVTVSSARVCFIFVWHRPGRSCGPSPGSEAAVRLRSPKISHWWSVPNRLRSRDRESAQCAKACSAQISLSFSGTPPAPCHTGMVLTGLIRDHHAFPLSGVFPNPPDRKHSCILYTIVQDITVIPIGLQSQHGCGRMPWRCMPLLSL